MFIYLCVYDQQYWRNLSLCFNFRIEITEMWLKYSVTGSFMVSHACTKRETHLSGYFQSHNSNHEIAQLSPSNSFDIISFLEFSTEYSFGVSIKLVYFPWNFFLYQTNFFREEEEKNAHKKPSSHSYIMSTWKMCSCMLGFSSRLGEECEWDTQFITPVAATHCMRHCPRQHHWFHISHYIKLHGVKIVDIKIGLFYLKTFSFNILNEFLCR